MKWNKEDNTYYFILCLLVITASLLVAIYVKKEFYEKEGMTDPFSFIIEIFITLAKMAINIVTIFTSLIKAFGYISDLFELLRCPMSIIFNFPTCVYFYIFDLFFMGIYAIMWLIVFINLYIPLLIASVIMCSVYWVVNKILDKFYVIDDEDNDESKYLCTVYKMEDIMFSKDSFFNFIDNLYYYLVGGHLLYRDRDDIGKCYCLPPIRASFLPLEKFVDLFNISSLDDESSKYYVIICMFIIVLLYFTNNNPKE